MNQGYSRKEARKLKEKANTRKQLKKATTVATTAAAVASFVAPTVLTNVQVAKAESYGTQTLSTSNYVAQLGQIASPIAKQNGLYASVMVAQALLESGWGSSTLSKAPYNNLFGIKGSYQGQSVTMKTMEYIKKKWVTVNAAFRKYPSMKESFQDNANLLRYNMGTFYSGTWVENTRSYKDATQWLQGRYATDPTYASKLNTIIENYRLTQYDNGKGSQMGSALGGTSSKTVNKYHTVVATDYLAKLAVTYKTTVAQIKKWNNLKSDVIYIGTKLKVGETVQADQVQQSQVVYETKTTTQNSYHTVRSGDSVWSLSQAYGTSMANIIKWNKIKNNLIYDGQRIIVKKTTVKTQVAKKVSTPKKTTVKKTTAKKTTTVKKTTTPKKQTTNTYYTVKPGDSVWAISDRYGISMNTLISWNKLQENFIYPGQKLIVKKATKTVTPKTASKKSSTSSKAKTVKVQSGDTLWVIATSHGLSVQQLKTKNGLKSDLIYVGQTLKV